MISRTPHHRPALRRRARQPPALRLLRRAPGPLRLRRHLRARPPRRRTRTASGRTSSTLVRELGVTDHPLPGRQLRLRLPVGGRRRAARPSGRAGSTSPGTRPRPTRSVSTSSPTWLREGRQRAHVRRQPRHPRSAGGARRPRVRQHPLGDGAVATCASPTAPPSRTASGCGASGTRWTGRGSSATAPPRTTPGSRSKTARAMRQIDPDLELVVCGSSSAADADVRRVGARRARGDVRRRRLHLLPRLLRADRTATTRASSRPRSNMDRFIDSVVATADHVKARAAAATRRCTSRSTSGTSGTSPATTRSTGSPTSTTWPVAPRLLEDVVLGHRRRRLRQPADLAAPARRPGDVGEPRAARERDRADHDRARRRCVAADDVLPVRAHLARSRAASTLELKLDCPTYRHRAATARCPSSMRSPPTTPTTGATAVFLVNRSQTRRSRSRSTHPHLGDVAIESVPDPPRRRHPRCEHAARPGAGRASRPNPTARTRPRASCG